MANIVQLDDDQLSELIADLQETRNKLLEKRNSREWKFEDEIDLETVCRDLGLAEEELEEREKLYK